MSKWKQKKGESVAAFGFYKVHKIPLNLYVEGYLTYSEYYYLTINQLRKGTYGKVQDDNSVLAGRVNLEKIRRAG